MAGYTAPQTARSQHADDGFIDVHRVFTSLADGIIEARFYNPYSTQEGSWTSGFMFRQGVSEEFHAVLIDDSGYWYQRSRTGDLDSAQAVAEGRSSHIDTSPSGSNHIRIIAFGREGWLFVNGALVAKLELARLLEAGVRVSRRLVLPWPRHPGQGDPVRRPHGSVGGSDVPASGAASTPTPTPTATPTPTPGTGSTGVATATPTPTNTPAASAPGGAPAITYAPSQPIAGRDITFTVTGLSPWQAVTVEFVDPLGPPRSPG